MARVPLKKCLGFLLKSKKSGKNPLLGSDSRPDGSRNSLFYPFERRVIISQKSWIGSVYWINLAVLLFILGAGCSNFSNGLTIVKKYHDGIRDSYKLALEKAYLYEENGTSKVLLGFYKKNGFFSADTPEWLHVYINGDPKEFNSNHAPNSLSAFFIRVQGRADYGNLKINNLKLTSDNNEKFNISATLASEPDISHHLTDPSLNLDFSNIPLIQVKSFNDIYNVDNDSFKEIIRNNIFAKWH